MFLWDYVISHEKYKPEKMATFFFLIYFLGMSKVMIVSLKDRCRYHETKAGTPISQTFSLCHQNQQLLNGQIYYSMKNDSFLNTDKIYRCCGLQSTVLLELQTIISYVTYCLHSKRHQFLSSASWEPFFIVTSVDINILLCTFEHALMTLQDLFDNNNMIILPPEIPWLTDELQQLKVWNENLLKFLKLYVSVYNDLNTVLLRINARGVHLMFDIFFGALTRGRRLLQNTEEVTILYININHFVVFFYPKPSLKQ